MKFPVYLPIPQKLCTRSRLSLPHPAFSPFHSLTHSPKFHKRENKVVRVWNGHRVYRTSPCLSSHRVRLAVAVSREVIVSYLVPALHPLIQRNNDIQPAVAHLLLVLLYCLFLGCCAVSAGAANQWKLSGTATDGLTKIFIVVDDATYNEKFSEFK